jgi:hypothetical protein
MSLLQWHSPLGDGVGVYQKGEILKSSQYKKEFFPQQKMEDLSLSSASAAVSDSLHLPSDNIASAMAKEGRWCVPGANPTPAASQTQPLPSSVPFSQQCLKCEGFALREVLCGVCFYFAHFIGILIPILDDMIHIF